MQHSVLSLIPFDNDERNKEEAKADKGPNDVPAIPGFRDATPLHCKNVAGHTSENKYHADEVHFDQHLPPAWTTRWRLIHKEEENDCCRDAADWQIDVEAAMLLANVVFGASRSIGSYHQRHVALLVKAPPMSGPTTLATP